MVPLEFAAITKKNATSFHFSIQQQFMSDNGYNRNGRDVVICYMKLCYLITLINGIIEW